MASNSLSGEPHLFVKKDEDIRIFSNAIGRVWDGNEVWLVTGAGALFAAFLSSCASMALLMVPFDLTVYPNMVLSMPNPELRLPIILAYTVSVYFIFRGKVKLTAHSY